jgi:hypothetical protein
MKPLGVTMPFAVADREYVAMLRFLNAAEDQHGIKMSALQPLDHQRSGLTLELSGGYELQWQGGMVLLGRCHQGKREQLFKGSPAVEATWAKMLDVMRSQEQKVKVEANRIQSRKVQFDVQTLQESYKPKLDRARQIRQ